MQVQVLFHSGRSTEPHLFCSRAHLAHNLLFCLICASRDVGTRSQALACGGAGKLHSLLKSPHLSIAVAVAAVVVTFGAEAEAGLHFLLARATSATASRGDGQCRRIIRKAWIGT